ncbi:MAG: TonB-dependent receptor, partial [Bacteroidota bacterium]
QADVSFEPRLGMKYNISDDIRLKFAGGLYSQNLVSSVNEQDIVNLFVGFLAGPEETIFEPGTRTPAKHRLQKAVHAIGGLEVDASTNLTFNVEGYFKDFTQLITVNRNKLSEQDPDFATETGEAYGVDFSAKYETKNLYLWGTYSLGYVTRFDGEQTYPTIFDRRHNVNLLATYNFGGNNAWEASARWNMGSGFPFTLTQGFYGQYNFTDGLDSDVLSENANLGILYADERNGGRLPYYHRMDVSLKRTFEFSKYSKLEAVLSVTNLYNRDNIFFFDRVEYERVDQLPILPSLGLNLTF